MYIPLKGRGIAIGDVRSDVEDEGKVVLDVFSGPVAPVEVQQTLVTTFSINVYICILYIHVLAGEMYGY